VVSGHHAHLGGTAGRADFGEELDVGLVIVGPFVGKVIFVVDGFDGTDGLARTAVDTLIRVDVKHAIALVNAVDGTLVDTGAVFDIDTREGDDIGHEELLGG